ncbi:MAG: protein-glutamate O-methyltransferase CheR [Spirochaetia bacterium]
MSITEERTPADPPSKQGLTKTQFQELARFIEGELGIRMPDSKKIMLESRLQKRVRTLKYSGFEQYLNYVFRDAQGKNELLHMIDAVTTNKTDFFREKDHFDYMTQRLLPERVVSSGWGSRGPLRVWSTASSSGEEPYTLAMVLEDFRATQRNFEYVILATDLSTAMLERGTRAVYTADRITPIPEPLKKKYLLRSRDREQQVVRIKKELRDRVRFHRLNLMADDFGIRNSFEIIFCRNVIIYFDRNNQAKLLRKLYNHLVPGGYLFLGHSETLAGMDLPLSSVAPTVYRKPE